MSIGKFDSKDICKQTSILCWLIVGLTAVLFVWGFIVPPKGEISNSVLKASTIFMGMMVFIIVREAYKEGVGAKVSHGETTIEISDRKHKAE